MTEVYSCRSSCFCVPPKVSYCPSQELQKRGSRFRFRFTARCRHRHSLLEPRLTAAVQYFILFLLVFGSSCTRSDLARQPSRSELSLWFRLEPVSEPLRVSRGSPSVYIQAQRLAGKLRTLEPILLDHNYVLEFIPLANHDKTPTPLVLRLFRVFSGCPADPCAVMQFLWDRYRPLRSLA